MSPNNIAIGNLNKNYIFIPVIFFSLFATYLPLSFFYILQSSIMAFTFYHLCLTTLLSFFSAKFIKKISINIHWAIVIPLCTLISSMFILTSNRILSSTPKGNLVTVVSKSYSSGKSTSSKKNYYVKVTSWKSSNSIETIHINYDVWNVSEVNSRHVVKVRTGIWGLDSLVAFY